MKSTINDNNQYYEKYFIPTFILNLAQNSLSVKQIPPNFLNFLDILQLPASPSCNKNESFLKPDWKIKQIYIIIITQTDRFTGGNNRNSFIGKGIQPFVILSVT